MAGLLDVSAKPKTHCSLLARRPLLYFDLWLKRLSNNEILPVQIVQADSRLYQEH
jgi:hypothetical protein